MPQPHYVTETQVLRSVVTVPGRRFIWTSHALERMAARDVIEADVVEVLTNGQVILEERKQDILWRVRGRDIDGRQLEIVVAVYEESIEIKVVTVF